MLSFLVFMVRELKLNCIFYTYAMKQPKGRDHVKILFPGLLHISNRQAVVSIHQIVIDCADYQTESHFSDVYIIHVRLIILN